MAKYEVTKSCGHTETVQLFGAGREGDRKLEWAASGRGIRCPRPFARIS
jgi:hypothetical protein